MKTRIAIVGLGFGAEFIPIYQIASRCRISCYLSTKRKVT